MNNQQESRPTALITGGSYGVGAATAFALARSGHNLALTATKRSNLDRTKAAAEALGARVAAIELDLTEQASIEAAVDQAVAELGRLDVLVNNAGAHGRKPALEITREDWDAIFEPNLTGTFFLTQKFGRHLIEAQRPGSIVSITSTHAVRGAPFRLMYGVSKAAIHQVTRMLAIEWAPHGIRVNAVAPGRMMTDSPTRQQTANDPGYIEAMTKKIPLNRLPTAEDCAAAVDFLCSPGAASITGHILMIDGGLTVQGSTS